MTWSGNPERNADLEWTGVLMNRIGMMGRKNREWFAWLLTEQPTLLVEEPVDSEDLDQMMAQTQAAIDLLEFMGNHLALEPFYLIALDDLKGSLEKHRACLVSAIGWKTPITIINRL